MTRWKLPGSASWSPSTLRPSPARMSSVTVRPTLSVKSTPVAKTIWMSKILPAMMPRSTGRSKTAFRAERRVPMRRVANQTRKAVPTLRKEVLFSRRLVSVVSR